MNYKTTRRKLLLGLFTGVIAISTPVVWKMREKRKAFSAFFSRWNSDTLSTKVIARIQEGKIEEYDRSAILLELIVPNKERIFDETGRQFGECGYYEVRDVAES